VCYKKQKPQEQAKEKGNFCNNYLNKRNPKLYAWHEHKANAPPKILNNDNDKLFEFVLCLHTQ